MDDVGRNPGKRHGLSMAPDSTGAGFYMFGGFVYVGQCFISERARESARARVRARTQWGGYDPSRSILQCPLEVVLDSSNYADVRTFGDMTSR